MNKHPFLTEEQIAELVAKRPPVTRRPKLRVAVAPVEVSPALAEVAKANPGGVSVRVSARSADDTLAYQGRPPGSAGEAATV